jgi:hypothetical protein
MRVSAPFCLFTSAMILASLAGPSVGEEPKIVVNCSCQTKKNPSWCETKLGDFEEHLWNEPGYSKPGAPLDKDGLALFCQRHADLPCLCKDIKYFKGTITR